MLVRIFTISLAWSHLMIRHAGVSTVAYEGANGDSEADAPVENGPFPLQLWVFCDGPRLFVIFARDKACTFELPPPGLLEGWRCQ